MNLGSGGFLISYTRGLNFLLLFDDQMDHHSILLVPDCLYNEFDHIVLSPTNGSEDTSRK